MEQQTKVQQVPNQTSTNESQLDQTQPQMKERTSEKHQNKEEQNLEKDLQKLALGENQQQQNSETDHKLDGDETQNYQTKSFVEINRENITFGKSTLFPGSIQQIDVSIGLKDELIDDTSSKNPFMLRVIAKCTNTQFNDLDEYVFSVRSNQRFEYFEEVRFKIKKKQRAQVKVAVKIPSVKQNYLIQGFLQIQLESLPPICLPITARCQVPQISCIKDLYKVNQDVQMIRIPAKKNQMKMPPIPFKNLSNFNFTLQAQTISNESFTNKPYDVIVQNFVNCQANTQFFVNMQLKQNMNYRGQMPTKYTFRKILILKIKNSSVFYNYPIEVNVFESSNNSNMS